MRRLRLILTVGLSAGLAATALGTVQLPPATGVEDAGDAAQTTLMQFESETASSINRYVGPLAIAGLGIFVMIGRPRA